MRTRIITTALALALMGGTASVASAQAYGGYNYDRGYTQDYRGVDRDRDGYRDGTRFDRRDDRFGTTWRRGMTFRDHYRFTVRDWNRFGLHTPGRGLHWVRQGNTFLLVNGRGRIVDVVFRPGYNRYRY